MHSQAISSPVTVKQFQHFNSDKLHAVTLTGWDTLLQTPLSIIKATNHAICACKKLKHLGLEEVIYGTESATSVTSHTLVFEPADNKLCHIELREWRATDKVSGRIAVVCTARSIICGTDFAPSMTASINIPIYRSKQNSKKDFQHTL